MEHSVIFCRSHHQQKQMTLILQILFLHPQFVCLNARRLQASPKAFVSGEETIRPRLRTVSLADHAHSLLSKGDCFMLQGIQTRYTVALGYRASP